MVVPGPMTASLAPRIDRDFAFADVTVGLVIAVFCACAAAASPSRAGWSSAPAPI